MEVKNVPITEIKPYEKNPRKNEAAVQKVVDSIREFGFQQPIVVDGKGCIIVGHTRFKAALKMGLPTVPVVYARNLSPQQVKAYRIADNKTNEFAEWDWTLLADEFNDLSMLGYDLTNTAFGKDEINALMTAEVVEDGFDVDKAVNEIIQPKSKVGDVFILGNHRVMCGDCLNSTMVDILMAGNLADMIFTDPPYNVNYEGSEGKKIKNDDMSDEKFYNFLYDAYISMFSAVKDGAGIYVCHADSEGLNFRKAFRDAGFDLKQCIIWVKNTFVMGRQDHHWQHEPILYGWKPGASHKWYGGRKQTTVIQPSDGITINKLDNKTTQVTLVVGLQRVVFNVGKYELLDFTDDTGTSIWNVEKPKKNGEHPCLHPDSLVETAEGWKAIASVQTWDKVLTADGEFHEVDFISTHAYAEPLYQIFANGKSTRATHNHPFLVYRNNELAWVNAENILAGDLIASPLNSSLERGTMKPHKEEESKCQQDICENGEMESMKWFTDLCGKMQMEKFQKDTGYTIKTKIKEIMFCPISNLSVPLHTSGYTRVVKCETAFGGNPVVCAENLSQLQQNTGISLNLDLYKVGGVDPAELPTLSLFALNNVESVERLNYNGVVYNLSVKDNPTFQTEIGMSHNTMKPLKLCAKAIRNSSLAGDIVLDLFGGSGSTLMAAEQLERKCYTMELDPVYCDVIVKRWEEFTGKKAYRVGE